MFEALLTQLKNSEADGIVIPSEKESLKVRLKSLKLSKQKTDFLRSDVFKLAQSEINSINYLKVLNWIEEMNKIILSTITEAEYGESVYFSHGEAGIKIKTDFTDKHMHHKFALFDGKTTLTGSYNWTKSAEQYNQENVLKTSSKRIYTAFETEFECLWNKLINYD